MVAFAACAMMSSCTQLEDTSYNSVIADGFKPTDEDVASLLSSAYVSWRKTMLLWNGVARAEMLCTDEDVIPARPNGWVDGGVYKRMHQHKWTSEDEIPLNSWVRTYDGINACNRVLYQIESGQNSKCCALPTTICSTISSAMSPSSPSLTCLRDSYPNRVPDSKSMSLSSKNWKRIFLCFLRR